MLAILRDYRAGFCYLGYHARTLHWHKLDRWCRKEATDIIQFCTLMFLAPGLKQGRLQCIDALLLASLEGQPYMDCLPGAAFSEEKLEATLGEVQHAKEDALTIVTVTDHQKYCGYLNAKPNLPRNIVAAFLSLPGIHRGKKHTCDH